MGPAEEFLALVRQQVRARAAGDDQGFGQECDIRPLNPGLIEAADQLAEAVRADAAAGAPAASRR